MEMPAIDYVYVRYLMASYLYYECYPVLPYTDREFAAICRCLLLSWGEVTHPHKHLCSPELLRAESGFDITFPNIVKGAAREWVKAGFDKGH
jgi:hypothetical protein